MIPDASITNPFTRAEYEAWLDRLEAERLKDLEAQEDMIMRERAGENAGEWHEDEDDGWRCWICGLAHCDGHTGDDPVLLRAWD